VDDYRAAGLDAIQTEPASSTGGGSTSLFTAHSRLVFTPGLSSHTGIQRMNAHVFTHSLSSSVLIRCAVVTLGCSLTLFSFYSTHVHSFTLFLRSHPLCCRHPRLFTHPLLFLQHSCSLIHSLLPTSTLSVSPYSLHFLELSYGNPACKRLPRMKSHAAAVSVFIPVAHSPPLHSLPLRYLLLLSSP
jgi:hypothetical protein